MAPKKTVQKIHNNDKAIERRPKFGNFRLSSITNSTDDAVALATPDGMITDWNKSAQVIYGLTKDEVIGKPVWTIVPAGAQNDVRKIVNRVKKGENLTHYEMELTNGKGKIFYISLSVALLVDSKGKGIGIISVARNITERKKASTEQERYRNFLENIHDACSEFDLHGHCTFCNDAAYQVMGYTREGYMNLTHRQRHPNQEEADKVFQIYNNLFKTGAPEITYESETLCKDGSVIQTETILSPIRDNRKRIIGFRSVGRDITERKKTSLEQERYRNFLENISDACFETDLKGNVTYANKATALRSGLTREEMIGIRYRRFIEPAEMMRINKTFREVYRTGESGTIRDCEIHDRNGLGRFVDMSVSLIRDAAGHPTGFRAISRDITERKKIEDALQLSEARYHNLFEYSKAVMLLIDPETTAIVDANHSACSYYGYTKEELLNKKVTEINTASPDEIQAELNRAKWEQRNHFYFSHRLKSGAVRPVEVFAGPVEIGGGRLIYSIIHDISERREAEEALRQSEEKYRTIIQNMQDVYFECDETGKFTFVNETACRTLGYEQDELLQYDYRAFTTPETAKMVKDVFQQTFATGISNIVDYEIISRDGSVYAHQLNVGLMKDADGNPIGFRVVSRDNTKRKQAEEALLLMQFSMDHAAESILLIDDLGYVTYANDAACTSMEYSREELKKLKVFDLDPDFPVNGWEKHKKDLKRLGQMTFEGRHRRKNGSLFPVEVTTNYLEYKGRFLGVAFDRDITERKRTEKALRASEEKYRTILSNMTDGYFELDLSGTITFANDAGCAMMEGGREQLLGQKAWQFMTPATRQYLTERYRKLMETARPDKMAEYEVITCAGSVRVHQANAVLKKNSADKPTGFSIVTRDITERKRAEEALRQSEERIRVLFNNIPVPTVVWKSRNDHLIMAGYNDAALQYTAGRIGDLLGRTIEECYPRAPHIAADMHQCFASQTNIEKSFWFPEGRGEEKKFVTIKYAFAPPDNVIMHVNDMTAQKKAEENLKHISIHDALTGLYNRFYSDAEIDRIRTSRLRPVSFIILDLNDLKIINDRKGHAAGDLYIKDAADLLKRTFRPEDMIARIGGDEFIVMLPLVDDRTCAQTLTRLKDSLAQFNLSADQPISFAAGVSTACAGDNIDAVIAEADRRMYEEKAQMKTAGESGNQSRRR